MLLQRCQPGNLVSAQLDPRADTAALEHVAQKPALGLGGGNRFCEKDMLKQGATADNDSKTKSSRCSLLLTNEASHEQDCFWQP